MTNFAISDNDLMMDGSVRQNSEWSRRVRPRFCPKCGHELLSVGDYCSQCGLPIPPDERLYVEPDASPSSRLVALILCIFLGYLGVHRFYVGKVVTGVIWLLTGGLFGIGYIVDIIMIALGNFTDIDGNRLVFWD
jgi:TM2 domain-containing membrane protein YozV